MPIVPLPSAVIGLSLRELRTRRFHRGGLLGDLLPSQSEIRLRLLQGDLKAARIDLMDRCRGR